MTDEPVVDFAAIVSKEALTVASKLTDASFVKYLSCAFIPVIPVIKRMKSNTFFIS